MNRMFGQRSVIWMFALLFAVGLAIRVALLPIRWINPDEGPHLMDARLVLEGQVPVADYGSRQPFYVIVLASALKVFGVHLTSGRLVPLTCNLLTALLIFWFGTRLGGVLVGAVAGSLWLFAPLSLIWSTVVKTEPLAVLLGAVSMVLVWQAVERDKLSFWLIAGVFAALAYYVRQATLYLPVAVALFLVWHFGGEWRRMIKGLIFYLAGFVVVVVLAFSVYVPRMGLTATLASQVDPANIVLDRLGRLLGVAALRPSSGGHSLRALGQSPDMTLRYLREAANLSAFLLPTWLAAVAATFSERVRRQFVGLNSKLHGLRLLASWSLAVVLLYTYHVSSRGFFTQYAVELYVPLVLVAAWVWVRTWDPVAGNEKPLIVWLGAFAGLFAFAVLGRMVAHPALLTGAALFTSFGALAFVRVGAKTSKSGRARVVFLILNGLVAWGVWHILTAIGAPGWVGFVVAVGFAVAVLGEGLLRQEGGATLAHYVFMFVLATLFVSGAHAGMRIGPTYECIWSPGTLRNVVEILQSPDLRNRTVLSGGMIWTFESGSPPYGNVTHPSQFLQREDTDFKRELLADSPGVIIYDGYTHRKFRRYKALLDSLLVREYVERATVEGSKYPVKIWVRR